MGSIQRTPKLSAIHSFSWMEKNRHLKMKVWLSMVLLSGLLGLTQACTTVSGPDPGKSCVFPFKFRGITYFSCTTSGNNPGNTKAWCSTKLDNSGIHVGSEGNWGDCEPRCQSTPIATQCLHNGKIYQDGDSFPDDCNTCICKNGRVQCTKKFCSGN